MPRPGRQSKLDAREADALTLLSEGNLSPRMDGWADRILGAKLFVTFISVKRGVFEKWGRV